MKQLWIGFEHTHTGEASLSSGARDFLSLDEAQKWASEEMPDTQSRTVNKDSPITLCDDDKFVGGAIVYCPKCSNSDKASFCVPVPHSTILPKSLMAETTRKRQEA